MSRSIARTKLAYLLGFPIGRAPDQKFFESENMTVEVEMTCLPTELQSLILDFQVRATIPAMPQGRVKVRAGSAYRDASGERNNRNQHGERISRPWNDRLRAEQNRLRTERYRMSRGLSAVA